MSKTMKRNPSTFAVVTFGCQMNARDSEKLVGILETMGLTETEEEQADIVIYNTCTIRENANQKLYGHLGTLKKRKEKNPDMIIGLCGCMMQKEDTVAYVQKKFPFVDLIFGTFNFHRAPEFIQRLLAGERQVTEIWDEPKEHVEHLPEHRKYPFKGGVNIMYGCNNFCTYCVVPYVRGRERSRIPEDILADVKTLAADGVREIMLLGQNVNSYGVNFMKKETSEVLKDDPDYAFSNLLRDVCRVDGILRVRFMTSHPKDLSDELILVIAEEEKACKHIHLPVQSGSTDVLRRMNRHYTREDYLKLVDKIRKAIPDVSLTTDIMVGFPGETDQDFADTVSLVEEVGYDQAFTFIYSVRSGTPAAEMEQLPQDLVSHRFQQLLEVVRRRGAEVTARFTGKTLPVLCEEVNPHTPGYLTGKTEHNITVHFPGDPTMVGKIISVRLEECKGFYYFGTMV